MKNRTDKILLAIFLLSLPLYGLIVSTYLEIIPTDRPEWLYTVHAWFAMGFHVVPAFCLQLLLCRRAPRWCSTLFGLVVVGTALASVCGFFAATGWDRLGWAILMDLSIVPAAGCVLAWTVFGLHQFYKRGNIRG